nr:retrovirus-related Pol polyprotein LINE-1 [Tanacetum cinerariifolium]
MKNELLAHQETISIMSQQKEDQTKAYKTREDKEIEKVIALVNKVKVLDDIVSKTCQSVQTMNMLNRNYKTSFVKPNFLKKAQRANRRLYDIGCYNDNLALMLAPNSDETIRLAQESRSKLSDLIRPFDYESSRAKDKAYEDLYKKLDSKEGANNIYKIAKAKERRRRNLENVREVVCSSPHMHYDCYYSKINQEEVRIALQKMGRNKVVGPDQIPIEAWRCLEDEKGEMADLPFQQEFLKGIKLLSHTMKLLERVIERRLKIETRVSENQFGYAGKVHDRGNSPSQKPYGEEILERHKGYVRGGEDLRTDHESAEGLNNRLESWRKALEDNGLRLSREKTEYLRYEFGRYEVIHQEVDIRIGDRILQPKESFRYLGSVIHRPGRIDEDVAHRIIAAIRPAMLYGSECWPITKAQANRMEVAELRMLRWTCGRTMVDMIPNGVFKAVLKVDSIIDKMREGRLRWFGHVKRRPQTAPVRRVEALLVDGVRRMGRPKLRWEDRLKMDMKELLLSEDMTSNRNAWRDRIRISCVLFCAYLGRFACLVFVSFTCLLVLCSRSLSLSLSSLMHTYTGRRSSGSSLFTFGFISEVGASFGDSPDEMASPEYITLLPATLPFLFTDSCEDSDPSKAFGSSEAPPSQDPYVTTVAPILIRPGEAIPLGRPYCTRPNGPQRDMTVRKRVGPLPTRRLAWRRVSPCFLNHRPSSSSSPTDSSPLYSLGLDVPGQAHSGSSNRVVSPRLGYLLSSSGDSSERPLHSSSHSAGPSRKRCRSPIDFVPSSAPVIGLLAPTRADLLPPHKRFRDSYSPETSMEEDIEIDTIETRDDRELDIVDRDDVRDHIEVDPMDDREEFEASAGDTVVLGIDLRSVPMVDEEIIEPVGGGSSSSSGTRDGTVRSIEDMSVDLDGAIHDFYPYMSEVCVDRIVGIETTQRKLEANQMIVSGERAGMAESIRSLRSENLKVRALLCIERDRVDSLPLHMSRSQEEFR